MIFDLDKLSLGFLKGKLLCINEIHLLALRSCLSFRFYSPGFWILWAPHGMGLVSASSGTLFDRVVIVVFGKMMPMLLEHGEMVFALFSFTSKLLYFCFKFEWNVI